RLPDPETLVNQHDRDSDLIRVARVRTRRVTGSDTVHGEDGYLNRIELWGDEATGRLELRADRLVYEGDDGERAEWPLESVTAVQASSSTLQINRRRLPLVSFRFEDDSIYLWEELLHAALRAFYRRTGRGEIVEFQPRVVTG
ncbi:MAG: hypothetical protein ACOC5I_00890, partial [Gemmatimonadota bacterium]